MNRNLKERQKTGKVRRSTAENCFTLKQFRSSKVLSMFQFERTSSGSRHLSGYPKSSGAAIQGQLIFWCKNSMVGFRTAPDSRTHIRPGEDSPATHYKMEMLEERIEERRFPMKSLLHKQCSPAPETPIDLLTSIASKAACLRCCRATRAAVGTAVAQVHLRSNLVF